MSIIHNIKQNVINSIGWKTKRKIIVFESDDWGSIRMRSKEDLDWFINNGYLANECPYNSLDSLENNLDMEGLMNTLKNVVDKNGQNAKFTLNNIVANPDFKKIKNAHYSQYFYESFIETLKRYPNSDRVFELYTQGLKEGVFRPQFHGREHLNIENWMDKLKRNDESAQQAFEREMFTIHKNGFSSVRKENLDAFGLAGESIISEYSVRINSGLNLFESLWGYSSKSFIAPTYVWPSEIENALFLQGVELIQGTHVQRVPSSNKESKNSTKYHYLGQVNKNKQIYLVRNSFFEPSSNTKIDWVDLCLKQIENAFFWSKPAIISSHRVNFIGSINPSNRTENLKLLDILLKKIIKKFPDAEFMFTDELGGLILKEKNVRN